MEQKEELIQRLVEDRRNRVKYLSPMVRFVRFSVDHVICGSPVPGGNEDIGYEEW